MKLTKAINNALIAIGIASIIGCTEDRVQKDVLKYEVYPKTMIDGKTEYLYVPSTISATRQTQFGQAYSLGDERVVTMELGEFALNVYSVDKETKFSDNPSNKRLVMTIPVDHVDYRCADDAFGECTSEEVENNRIEWSQRKFFKPKFDQVKLTDPNFLPSDLPADCFQTKETKLVGRTLTPDSINFKVERTYQNQLFFFCTRGLTDLQDLNWSDVSHYSLVRLDTLASKNYKTAEYHPDWINTFGFFEQDDNRLDVDGNPTQALEKKYITRWNPERSAVIYYLSEAFNKSENAGLKAATYESFKRINSGLGKAGVKFRLELREPSADIDPGDIRNSMIILAEDPFEASIIGYGPSVANPQTGEILSARTVMYSGSIKRFVRFTYDEILIQQGILPNKGTLPGPVSSETTSPSVLSKVDLLEILKKKVNKPVLAQTIDRTPELSEKEIDQALEMAARKDYMMQLAEQSKYPAEALSFGDVTQTLLKQMVSELGELRAWESLSEDQRSKVMDVLVPYVWVPTLIHEVGHNLGLRHNFSGSEDSANQYSLEELGREGVPADGEVPYSSIMDYPRSEINALRTLGKYDIAALRFGYTGKVELANNSVVDVNAAASPVTGLRAYSYCSDEGVDPNPTCNPFDEGEGYTAIANSLISSYKESYVRSNFRRGRANFSAIDDDMYYARVQRTFRKLRMMYESYENLVNKFQLDQATIDEIDWLKDLDGAVEIAADFMMDVIAQPDTTCLVQTAQGIQLAPISIFPDFQHGNTRDCFQLDLPEQFQVIGQGGKAINSLKLPTNPNRYADQIDVRGAWIDKAVAMNTLFRRKLNSSIHDDFNGNFLDHPKVQPKLIGFLQRFLSNQLEANVNWTFIDGTTAEIPIPNDMSLASFEIQTPELPIISRVLGVPYDNLHTAQMLTMILRNGLSQGSANALNTQMRNALSVETLHPGTDNGTYLRARVGSHMLYVHESSTLAFDMMARYKTQKLLESTDAATLEKISALHAANGTDVGLTATEKVIFDLGAETVAAFLGGATTVSTYYEPLLLALAGTR